MREYSLNVNDYCTVKLTNFGQSVLEDHYSEYLPDSNIKELIDDIHSVEDVPGIYRFQLWEIFRIFGNTFHLGMPEVPFEDNVITLAVLEATP